MGVHGTLIRRVYRKVLKWFGNVQQMENYRLTKRVHMLEVRGEMGEGGHLLS